MNQNVVKVKDIEISNDLPIILIGGPCLMESRSHALEMAHALKEITDRVQIKFIFKTSFDKANRTSIKSSRGVGFKEGIDVFAEIKEKYNLATITDMHEIDQADELAKVVDVIQIPALLCKQTDIITAAAKTGCAIEVKKGQFLAPDDMPYIIEKVTSTGNNKFMICERGSCFGYHKLINDMAGIHLMSKYGYPIIFDGTHSVQEPAALGNKSGGNRELVPYLSRAAVSIGVAGLYWEIHENPDNAPCDGPNMVKLKDVENLIKSMKEFDLLAKNYNKCMEN